MPNVPKDTKMIKNGHKLTTGNEIITKNGHKISTSKIKYEGKWPRKGKVLVKMATFTTSIIFY